MYNKMTRLILLAAMVVGVNAIAATGHTAPADTSKSDSGGEQSHKTNANKTATDKTTRGSGKGKGSNSKTRSANLQAVNGSPKPPELHPESSVNFTNEKAQEVTVDPASGALVINIPLVNISQNDGLPFNITVHYRTDGNMAGNLVTLSNGWDIFSGTMPSMGPDSPFWKKICTYPVFLLPDGSSHVFYPKASECLSSMAKTLNYSKDHWKGNIQIYGTSIPYEGNWGYRGTVISPEGNQYQMDHLLQKITSAHGGAVINYKYSHLDETNWTPVSITSNQGLNAVFSHLDTSKHSLLSKMTLGPSIWTFGYDKNNRLTSIKKPDGSAWSMTYDKDNHLATFTTPLGLEYLFSYAKGKNDKIYSKKVVTTMTRYAPKLTDLVIKYNYKPPQLKNGNFDPVFNTEMDYPDRKIINTYQTGLKKNGDGFLPEWNKSLLVKTETRDLKGKTAQTITSEWGKRSIADHGGMSDAPLLMKQTIVRGATYTNSFTYDNDGFETRHTESSPFGSRETDTTWYKNPNLWIFAPQKTTLYSITSGQISDVANTVEREFNSAGEVIRQTENGVAMNYAYNSRGDLTSQTDALNQTAYYAEYVTGVPQTVTDPKGNVSHSVISKTGLLTQKTDPLGHTTKYAYDNSFRLVTLTPPEGLPTTWSYGRYTSPANVATLTEQHGGKKNTTWLNTLGLPDHTIQYNGSTAFNEIWFDYDVYGQKAFVSNPSTPGAAIVRGTLTTHDMFGRPLSVTDAASFHTKSVVEEAVKYDYGNVNRHYVSKTPGVVRKAIVTADLNHHEWKESFFSVNGQNHAPYDILEDDHWYDYLYRYEFSHLNAKSPGYVIDTQGGLGGHVNITLTVLKPN